MCIDIVIGGWVGFWLAPVRCANGVHHTAGRGTLQPSGPFSAMHSSRGSFVMGHEQQIFFPLFPTFGVGLSSPITLRDAFQIYSVAKSFFEVRIPRLEGGKTVRKSSSATRVECLT